MLISRQVLRIAAVVSFAVAIFQAVISFSPSWSRYFGAPEPLASSSPLLLVAGLAAAVIFAVFGFYALAGAGDIRSLPLLRLGLLAIGSVFTLRGLFVIPVLLIMTGILPSPEDTSLQGMALASSLISLSIGLVYLAGTILGWRELRPRTND